MSRVRADRLTNRAGTGAPTFPNGAVITGVATATSFAGAATGLTGNFSGNAAGLTGTPSIVVGSVTGTTGSFSGNVSVGGTLTYEDVTNIDSVGIVTARTGIKVLAGGINAVGVVTATSFSGDGSALTGVESWNQFDTWLYSGG